MFLPPRYQETDQVDVQLALGRVGGLADGRLAERGGNVLQDAV